MKYYSFLLLEASPTMIGSTIALAKGGDRAATLQALANMFQKAKTAGRGATKASFEKGGDILNFTRKVAADATAGKRKTATDAVRRATQDVTRKAERASQEARKVGELYGSGAASTARGVEHSINPLTQTPSEMTGLITSAEERIKGYGKRLSDYISGVKGIESEMERLIVSGEIGEKQMLNLKNMMAILRRQRAIISDAAATPQQKEAAAAVVQKTLRKYELSKASFDLGSARNFAVANLNDAGNVAATDFTRGIQSAEESLGNSERMRDVTAAALERVEQMSKPIKKWYQFWK